MIKIRHLYKGAHKWTHDRRLIKTVTRKFAYQTLSRSPPLRRGAYKKNMMKWKELENDPKKSVLEKKDKKDCKYWEWFGTDGCHIKYWKCCLFCLDYEVKDEQ